MRVMAIVLSGCFLFVGLSAKAQQKEPKVPARYKIEAQPNHYPQATPKETLASVLRAIEEQRFGYLFAHLLDPTFVDEFVQRSNGDFEEVVKQGMAKMREDPSVVADLKKILQNGEWEEGGDIASARHRDIRGKSVFLKKIDKRWFLENRQQADKAKS